VKAIELLNGQQYPLCRRSPPAALPGSDHPPGNWPYHCPCPALPCPAPDLGAPLDVLSRLLSGFSRSRVPGPCRRPMPPARRGSRTGGCRHSSRGHRRGRALYGEVNQTVATAVVANEDRDDDRMCGCRPGNTVAELPGWGEVARPCDDEGVISAPPSRGRGRRRRPCL
jgi:hypothetical protein